MLRKGLTISALVLSALTVLGQGEWSRRQYTSESGLLQNRVHAMERDEWGALIVGTEGGLVRFDGERFRQIGIPAPEGMRPSRVIDMVRAEDGSLVVRDAGSRQYHYKDDVLISLTGDAPARKPTSRFSGGITTVEVAVAAMDPDSILPGKETWPYTVRPIPLGGSLWCVRTEHEFLLYDGKTLKDRFAIPMGRWSHLVKLGDVPYVFDLQGKAYRVNMERKVAEPVLMAGFPVADMRQGQLTWRMYWCPRDNSVSLVAGGTLYMLHLGHDGTTVVAEALDLELPQDCRVGVTIWLEPGQVLALGTDTKGLFIYRRNTMRTLSCGLGSDGGGVAYTAQAPFREGEVLTSTRGVPRLFTSKGCEESDAGFRGMDEVALKQDARGSYWYGRGDTLFRWEPRSKVESMVAVGVKPFCFLEETDGMWVGSAKGVFRVGTDGVQLKYPLNEKDLAQRPTSLCRTAEGELWVATCAGVYRASLKGELELVPGLVGVCARVLSVVDEGVLVGTYGSGAYLVSGSSIRRLPLDEHGFLSHVHGFMPDAAGFLWMSTNQGLFRMRRADLAADTGQHVYYAYYGKQAGILNPEFNGGCDPPFVRTGDGWASFPSMDGLVWFRPEAIQDAYPSNKVLVEQLEVDGVLRAVSSGVIELPWDHHEVVVRISLAYWGDQENAKLEYRLEDGRGGAWVPLRGGRREIRLNTLSSGSPKLRVRKVGAEARGEADSITLLFAVPVPYYRTFWFISLCVVGGALLFWSLLRFNAARLRRKNLQLERKVRERTGELLEANAVLRRSLEMKEMLVSIISHDIVTPLRFIARVANGAARSAEDRVRLEDTLHDLSRSSDKLYANAQDLLQWIKRQDGRIDLRPRNVAMNPLVEEVLDMERERAMDKGVLLVNAVSIDDVVRVDRNVLSIILHNLVANAVTHTEVGAVTVTGQTAARSYSILVKDTGSGLPEAAWRHAKRVQHRGALGAMNGEGERDVQGLGLLIVADLLQLMGGRFEIASSDENGTAIKVYIPLADQG